MRNNYDILMEHLQAVLECNCSRGFALRLARYIPTQWCICDCTEVSEPYAR